MSASQTANHQEVSTETFNMFDFDFGPNAKNNAFLANLMKNVELQEKFADKEDDEDDDSDVEDDSEGESEEEEDHVPKKCSDGTSVKPNTDLDTSSSNEKLDKE